MLVRRIKLPFFRTVNLFPLALVFSSFGLVAFAEPTREQFEFFDKKVRPIFEESCYRCHSVEQGKSKGGLTLDTRDGWQKGGENGPAVEPGNVDKSLILKAVSYEDADLQMPPKGEKLSPAQIADLTTWVKMGAPDPRKGSGAITSKLSGLTDKARGHWAYQPVTRPAVPTNKNQQWCQTPVDAFILQKLEAAQMTPAPSADKETLLRRATYDLIGLPPTTQEVAAFLADETPGAFAKVIDRLLASPHYGERWGRFWLDTARYSDTIGGERNAVRRGADYRYPYAWTYRDYVIKAFNEDKPYDQFIIEQLAADKLPAPKSSADLAALGFLTVGERFRNVNDIINDRIDVVSKGFLGMTVTCARCHDHMFDPISTKDYYALHGVFASTIEPQDKPVIGAPPQHAEILDYEQKRVELETRDRLTYYKLITELNGEVQKKIAPLLLASQSAPRKGATAEEIKARNELLNNYKVNRDHVGLMLRYGRRDNPVFAPWRRFMQLPKNQFAAKAPEIIAEISRRSESDRNRGPTVNPLVAAAFKDATPQSLEDVARIYEQMFAEVAPQLKAYVEACSKAQSDAIEGFDPALVQILETPFNVLPAPKITTDRLQSLVGNLPNNLAGRTNFEFAKINELELTHPGAPARPMLVADVSRPKDSQVFIRGQAETRGDFVPRRFLEVLSPAGKPAPFKEGSGRLELAQSIASKANPLTARVMVNRVWMHHFGEGFVPTLDDLGTQSEPPSHPELLDYLASYFMDQGWSLKKLHKLILLSRVYQESSQTNAAYEKQDPQNRLLWRANIRRLDFEAMRDSLLVFSGNLDHTVGGRPINLTDEPYSYRRSVYGYIDRGNLPELMAQFDFSDPDMPNSKRTSTVVPQQALFLMNSPMAIDVARKIMASSDVADAPDNLRRIFAIYRVIFQRTPKPDEIQLALRFVGEEMANAPQTADDRQAKRISDERQARLRARERQAQKGRYGAMAPIKNRGELVERKPLTPWETYAQALLLSNEAAYVN